MGGSSNPIKKIVEDVKDKAKEVGESKVIRYGIDPIGAAQSKFMSDITGIDDAVFDPAGAANEAIVKKTVEEPRKLKEQMARENELAASAQEAQLREIEGRRKQASAEKRGAEDLMRARQRQRRRTGGTGRGSTILSGQLGGVSGDGRKNLLGL